MKQFLDVKYLIHRMIDGIFERSSFAKVEYICNNKDFVTSFPQVLRYHDLTTKILLDFLVFFLLICHTDYVLSESLAMYDFLAFGSLLIIS